MLPYCGMPSSAALCSKKRAMQSDACTDLVGSISSRADVDKVQRSTRLFPLRFTARKSAHSAQACTQIFRNIACSFSGLLQDGGRT